MKQAHADVHGQGDRSAPEPTRHMRLFLLTLLLTLCAGLLAYARYSRHDGSTASGSQVLEFTDLGAEYVGYLCDPSTHTISLETNHPATTRPLSLADAPELERDFVFATNGGIFAHPNAPVGLTVRRGEVLEEINLSSGDGNFFLEPNGVFLIDRRNRAHVIESHAFEGAETEWTLATQSGPLLVDHGRLHPAFNEGSPNRRIRSGVGMRDDGAIVLLVSRDPVTFWEFATLFRDGMGCPNALYLDGTISGFALPQTPPSSPSAYASLLIVSPI